MQSIDALRSLAAFDREIIENLVRAFFDARARGDNTTMLGFYAPTAVVTLMGDTSLHPCAGRYVGIEAIADMLRRIDTNFEYVDADITDLVIDHDTAVIRRFKTMRHVGTGEIRRLHMCDWIRFQNGQIVEVTEYSDTALTSYMTSA